MTSPQCTPKNNADDNNIGNIRTGDDVVNNNDTIQPEEEEASIIAIAAKCILDADFLVIGTGAGMSADSNLPTYTDVAKNPIYEHQNLEYNDLCRVQCLKDNPDLFYGFWGMCYNSYHHPNNKPHNGYTILQKWCQQKDEKNKTKKQNEKQQHDTIHNKAEDGTTNSDSDGGGCGTMTSSYYHYTSNVDGYFRRIGVPTDLIHEIHGSIDQWLPVDGDDNGPSGSSCGSTTISIPESFTFPVDPTTLLVSPNELMKSLMIGTTETAAAAAAATNTSSTSSSSSSSTLSSSSTTRTSPTPSLVKIRPRVLMFDDDFKSHDSMGLHQSSVQYQDWEEEMERTMEQSNTLQLVVLEIGCGIRVPSVRNECQDVIQDTALRCCGTENNDDNGSSSNTPSSSSSSSSSLPSRPRCTLIRINPEHYEITDLDDVSPTIRTISIAGRALETLARIDKYYEKYNNIENNADAQETTTMKK